MDAGEIALLVVSSMVACLWWLPYYVRLVAVRRGSTSRLVRLPLYLAPLLSLAVLGFVLRQFASFDVQDAPIYLTFYMAVGAGWLALAGWIFAGLGISYRDDAIERGNIAASSCLAGAMVGVSLIYAGANIGDGPGWWVVLFTAAVAAAVFFAGWLALEVVVKIGETITVDRDASAGLRVGALFLATGAVLGRAAAGNWYGPAQAVKQVMEVGVGALGLFVVGMLIEKLLQPSPDHPVRSIALGALVASVYLGAAATWISLMGWWT